MNPARLPDSGVRIEKQSSNENRCLNVLSVLEEPPVRRGQAISLETSPAPEPPSPRSVYHHSGMCGGTREGWNDTTQPSLGYLLCLLFQLRHYQRMQIARSRAGISPRPRQSALKSALMGGGGGPGDKVDWGSVGDELGGRE